MSCTCQPIPPIGEVTAKSAASLAGSAVGILNSGAADPVQLAEAAQLLRTAAGMLAPPGLGSVCRCDGARGVGVITVSNGTGDPLRATGAVRSAMRLSR